MLLEGMVSFKWCPMHVQICDPEDMVSLDATLRQFSFEYKMKFTSVEEKLQINGTSFREALETDSFYLSSSAALFVPEGFDR